MRSSEMNRGLSLLLAPYVIWRDLIEYRHLIAHFIRRDLKLKYHKSFFGYLWSLIEPLVLTGTFYLLFVVLVDSPNQLLALNIMIGLMTWSLFSGSFGGGTRAFEQNSGLIQTACLPRSVYLLSNCGYQAVCFAMSMVVALPLMVFFGLPPTLNLLWLPYSVLMITILALGLSMITSVIQTRFRDIAFLVDLVLRIGFFLSPVFYTLETLFNNRIPMEYAEPYMMGNPMAVYLTTMRSSITGVTPVVPMNILVLSTISSVVIFLLGSMFFQWRERQAVKYL